MSIGTASSCTDSGNAAKIAVSSTTADMSVNRRYRHQAAQLETHLRHQRQPCSSEADTACPRRLGQPFLGHPRRCDFPWCKGSGGFLGSIGGGFVGILK